MVKRNQGKREITFDPRMKITLLGSLLALLLLSERIKDQNNVHGENTTLFVKSRSEKFYETKIKNAPLSLPGKQFNISHNRGLPRVTILAITSLIT